jgi:hypothetical protein
LARWAGRADLDREHALHSRFHPQGDQGVDLPIAIDHREVDAARLHDGGDAAQLRDDDALEQARRDQRSGVVADVLPQPADLGPDALAQHLAGHVHGDVGEGGGDLLDQPEIVVEHFRDALQAEPVALHAVERAEVHDQRVGAVRADEVGAIHRPVGAPARRRRGLQPGLEQLLPAGAVGEGVAEVARDRAAALGALDDGAVALAHDLAVAAVLDHLVGEAGAEPEVRPGAAVVLEAEEGVGVGLHRQALGSPTLARLGPEAEIHDRTAVDRLVAEDGGEAFARGHP